jgi:hypothetical protein
MNITLLFISIAILIVLVCGFMYELIRGRVRGAHPVGKNLAWIDRSEHPSHFWGYTVLHIVVYVILAWILCGLWNSPAF